ncbi:MAG TPA: sulfite reductase subunit alpha [Tahibacter sp.]|uniref:sulfite reductase subunit alpha n=1 Tax=Tahibacter sp. TaxID=2056211 RepID=UPI002CE96B81|nr:sulfite reductase subunit alpha [Tahibacter sp.]HSX61151.1 sulfite reductase subunit alpha [Tahibacter sp.]
MSAIDPLQRRAIAGNVATLVLLALIALAAGAWQRGAIAWQDPGSARLAAAAGVVAAFAGFVFLLRLRRIAPPASSGVDDADATLVVFASQTGMAEYLAQRTLSSLVDAGHPAQLVAIDRLDEARLRASRCALFVVSTYGEGDPPDMAARFTRRLLAHSVPLAGLRYGVLALGDSAYAEFCGFGRRVDAWLRQQGAQALFDRIDVDNGDAGALRHWQHQLGVIAGRSDEPDWSTPRYASWRLVARRELNPGSVGGACFLLALEAPAGEAAHWDAGDVAEIGPRHAPEAVAAQLARWSLDGAQRRGDGETVADFLARHQWPETLPVPDAAGDRLAALKPLPHREYSIASIPRDGRLELLVRQWRRDDGTLGVGSGWLTAHAPPGGTIALRLRANRQFHAPVESCPLILIGNGTGIAGLRALLKARAAAGRARNWLLFGERQRARDFFFSDEIDAWQRDGLLERVDLAFSRDQPERVYVQQRVREAAVALRAWVADGACVYVCGSLQGMAPAVDAELRAALGAAVVDALAEQGRYRRDVY